MPDGQGRQDALLYKEVFNRLETESPGTKQYFYWGFLEKQRKKRTHFHHHGGEGPGDAPPLCRLWPADDCRNLLLLQADGASQGTSPVAFLQPCKPADDSVSWVTYS